ncbi:hypothetical protein CBS147333_4305 [Penicillium roqueforti]|nr:hypothetical protein CBS147333_4305 [Penicillium roqueforti]KAI3276215.1 hypothetical protein CBS147308_1656 [Penicillium roqueforti]KAI3295160.1 hypothetical protein DTO003C3_2337 [Penicillium roqueforti]KAI3298866.1 hypothetical protein DTO002I6_2880 [Penicillium roqueforti]
MNMNSSLAARRRVVPAEVDTTNHEWFYPKKTVEKQRPNSGATFFDDTDSESGDWRQSHRQSMQSYSNGSNTTLSSPELPTPDLLPRNLPTFRSSKELIAGPSGPDLFRGSRGSTVDVEFYLEPSPSLDFKSLTQPEFVNPHQAEFVNQYQAEFVKYQDERPNQYQPERSNQYQPEFVNRYQPEFVNQYQDERPNQYQPERPNQYQPERPNQYQPEFVNQYQDERPNQYQPERSNKYQAGRSNPYLLSPKTPKAFPRNPDVSHLSKKEIRNWDPSQVAHWLFIGGYPDDIRDTFLKNDITGDILMTLTKDELEYQLRIQSMGRRVQLIQSIDYLLENMQTRPIPETPSQFPSEAASSNGRRSPESFAPQELAPKRTPTGQSYTMSISPDGKILSSHAFGQSGDQSTADAESVSIVGIEEFHPKPHRCSKGEKCSKFKKLKEKRLKKLTTEYPGADFQGGAIFVGSPGNPETARNLLRPTSEAELSAMASSNIFGPRSGPRLSEAALSEVQRLDPQETIRNFLRHQHIDDFPKPGPLGLDTYNLPPADDFEDISPLNAQSNSMAANLRSLPRLTIPTSPLTEDMTTAVTTNRYFTPTHQNGSPTAVQQFGPFSQVHQAQATETYRQGTPFSEVDVPITAIPSDPISRDVSQSVPPSMQYGTLFPPYRDANHLSRSNSTRPSDDLPLRDANYFARSTSTRPRDAFPLRQVNEGKPLTPIDVPADLIRSPRVNQYGNSSSLALADPEVTHAGYMKKRKTTRLLRHEWSDAHFTLRGTNLAMHKDERDAHRISRALENIEVDEYAVACSSLATSSKLTAAFKRSILRNGNSTTDIRDGTAFAFSLIPATKESEKKALFGNSAVKTHHFAVKSREERIDWMRELMLARALKKGRDGEDGTSMDGNMI